MQKNADDFVVSVIKEAKDMGYIIEVCATNGLQQIDFGNKKLHAGHLKKLFPAIMADDAHVPSLINAVAPGRPCSHRPMREIIQKLRGS